MLSFRVQQFSHVALVYHPLTVIDIEPQSEFAKQ